MLRAVNLRTKDRGGASKLKFELLLQKGGSRGEWSKKGERASFVEQRAGEKKGAESFQFILLRTSWEEGVYEEVTDRNAFLFQKLKKKGRGGYIGET